MLAHLKRRLEITLNSVKIWWDLPGSDEICTDLMRSARIWWDLLRSYLQGICEDLGRSLGICQICIVNHAHPMSSCWRRRCLYARSSAAEDGDVYTSEVSEIQSVISSDWYKEMAFRHLKKISNTFEKD